MYSIDAGNSVTVRNDASIEGLSVTIDADEGDVNLSMSGNIQSVDGDVTILAPNTDTIGDEGHLNFTGSGNLWAQNGAGTDDDLIITVAG